MKILITGGAGFVGSRLALSFKDRNPKYEVDVFDNLKRRGSESNLTTLRRQGIRFVHGDLRVASDFDELGKNYDLLIDAAAEPSVLAGVKSSPSYVIDTNLRGSLHTFDFARRHAPNIIFLSTSRVYAIGDLQALPLKETKTRFEMSGDGISESFAVNSARSFYGFTKLASEYALQEYADQYGINAIINRCGVIAGPGQFGKADQGVFTLWVAHHIFGKALCYQGFGGSGKQVRDLLHPDDLFSLLESQISAKALWKCEVYNVGGGMNNSVSLAEYTSLCQDACGAKVEISSQKSSSRVDVPYYVSNNAKVKKAFAWEAKRNLSTIVKEIHQWINFNRNTLAEHWAL